MNETSAPPQVRLIGLPTDSHSSFLRGAAAGPAAIRAALASDQGNAAAENGLELGTDILVEDAGDLPLGEAAGDPDLIRAAILAAITDRAVPISLDGDPLSHASPFARIMEGGHARRLVQFGIRTLNRHCREQARRFGVEIVEMRDFAPDRVPIPEGPLYISIDLDGFDPAFAPGVSHHEPGGASVREFLSVLHRVRGPIVGADIVELNPSREVNGVTAILAAKLVKELAALAVETRT